MKSLNQQLSLKILVKKISNNSIYLIENKINKKKGKGTFFLKRNLKNTFITESLKLNNFKFPLEIIFLTSLNDFKTSLFKDKDVLCNIIFTRFKNLYIYEKRNLLNFFFIEYIFLNFTSIFITTFCRKNSIHTI